MVLRAPLLSLCLLQGMRFFALPSSPLSLPSRSLGASMLAPGVAGRRDSSARGDQSPLLAREKQDALHTPALSTAPPKIEYCLDDKILNPNAWSQNDSNLHWSPPSEKTGHTPAAQDENADLQAQCTSYYEHLPAYASRGWQELLTKTGIWSHWDMSGIWSHWDCST